jgi:hypothetical protein
MGTSIGSQFRHSLGWDGVYESHCRGCLRSVGRAQREIELGKLERLHDCDAWQGPRDEGDPPGDLTGTP